MLNIYDKEFNIASYVADYLRGDLDGPARQELETWLSNSEANRSCFEKLVKEDLLIESLRNYRSGNTQAMWEHTRRLMQSDIVPASAQIWTAQRLNRIWVTIAASLVVVLGIWFYTLISHERPQQAKIARNEEIVPGQQSATLTLANGKQIRLTQVTAGKLTEEAGVKITKSADGQLTYTALDQSVKADPTKMNKLSTNNGERYMVILPDQSKVWLNAASSLKYPVSLKDMNERVVELIGEGYFEVAKDNRRPFIVRTPMVSGRPEHEIRVLGTHFNLSAYPSDAAYVTTLVEGKVKVSVSGNSRSVFLLPGQQSVAAKSLQVNDAYVDAAVAWRDGYFYFAGEDISSVMRKLERWYNIDIDYQGGEIKESFWGRISTSKPLSKVLSALEATNEVHFKIQGRRVTVIK